MKGINLSYLVGEKVFQHNSNEVGLFPESVERLIKSGFRRKTRFGMFVFTPEIRSLASATSRKRLSEEVRIAEGQAQWWINVWGTIGHFLSVLGTM